MLKKKIQKSLIFILLGSFVLMSFAFIQIHNVENRSITGVIFNDNVVLKQSAVYYESGIYIDDDFGSGYEWSDYPLGTWLSRTGSTGSYTYYIRHMYIDGGGNITIRDSSENFYVENCTVINSDSSGIMIINADNGNLIGNNFSNNDWNGIYIGQASDYTLVENNTCLNNNNNGIHLVQSNTNDNTFRNNTCNLNGNYGINIDSTDNTVVEDNTCSWNDESGIRVGGDTSSLDNNECNNNLIHGIYLDQSDNNPSITGNTCNDNGDCGIYLSFSDYNTLTSNSANGNGEAGIYLKNCRTSTAWNNVLSSNTLSNNKYGIHLDYSIYNYVGTSNVASGNTQYGIYLENKCEKNNVTGNVVNGNDVYGIYLYDQSTDNSIISNTASNNAIYDICYYSECVDNIFLYNNVKEVDLANPPGLPGFRWDYAIAILVLLGFISFIGGIGYLEVQKKKRLRENNMIVVEQPGVTFVRPGLVYQQPRIQRSDNFLPVEIIEGEHSHKIKELITPKEIEPYEFYCAKCDQKSLGYQVFCPTCGERMRQPKLAAMHNPDETVQCVICHTAMCSTCDHDITGDDACFEECPYCERSYHKHCWNKTMQAFGKCGFCLETPPPQLIPNAFKTQDNTYYQDP